MLGRFEIQIIATEICKLFDMHRNNPGNVIRIQIFQRLTSSILTLRISEGQVLQWSEIRDRTRIQDDVNFFQPGGYTLLHACAEYGDETGLRELIKLGANIEATDRHGDTPLSRAVIAHQGGRRIEKNVAGVLLEARASIQKRCYGTARYESQSKNSDSRRMREMIKAEDGSWPWPGVGPKPKTLMQ
jgi:ankyrin repeat protein